MPEPTEFLRELRTATADLVRGFEDLHWSAEDVGAPSLCTGWTRGHVLTHVARNADGISDTIDGALRGEIVERYPGGWDARNATIDAGATRPFAELVADVRNSAERLDRVLDAVHDAGAWDVPTDEDQTPETWVYRRWREVLVHRVDLDADFTPDQWPPLFVRTELAAAAASLTKRADRALLVRVTPEGSVVSDHERTEWRVGSGDAVEVIGPDWAVLAWLAGRGSAAAASLTATPNLTEWR